VSTASEPQLDIRRTSVQADPDIYEPIYDSRWRLLNQASKRFFSSWIMAQAFVLSQSDGLIQEPILQI
jgi:hypothetical protein